MSMNIITWIKKFHVVRLITVFNMSHFLHCLESVTSNLWNSETVAMTLRPRLQGTGPLRDLIGSVPKRSHESGPKLFLIARPFTWDRIIHQIAKITAVFVGRHLLLRTKARQKVKVLRNKFEKQVSLGHMVFMLRLGYCKKLLLHVHFGCWAWKAKRIHNGICPAHLHEAWTDPGPYLDFSSSGPTSYWVSRLTSYRFQKVPCERKAYLDPIWNRSQIYPVPCKRGLNDVFAMKYIITWFGYKLFHASLKVYSL